MLGGECGLLCGCLSGIGCRGQIGFVVIIVGSSNGSLFVLECCRSSTL